MIKKIPAEVWFLPLLCLFILTTPSHSQEVPPTGAIASAHPLATRAGLNILNSGGNAFDAAVAVASSLAVVEPYSSGIGGGGFFLVFDNKKKSYVFLDARETAPGAAFPDMYLKEDGNFDRLKSLNGPLAAGIPGLPAGLVHLSKKYGKKSLSECFKEAIDLAENGFEVGPRYLRMAGFRKKSFVGEAKEIFLGGTDLSLGERIVQKDLASTLRSIASDNARSFYNGSLADRLVSGVKQHGGIWDKSDLSSYTVIERTPLYGKYEGVKIISAPLPSSGGIVLLQSLNILRNYELGILQETDRIHVITEAMKRAYRDRADFLGDPDYNDIDVKKMISLRYADQLASDIKMGQATPSNSLKGLTIDKGKDTTHFSVLDEEGNRVAATLSINYPFGASFVVPGTGVLLNNEMDDFSASPLAPNAYGLVGNHANSIQPGKRPLSSMTPTFLESNDRIGIIGTPGGSRIISMVLISSLEFVEGKLPAAWVKKERFHHQYMPDILQFEKDAFSPSLQQELERRGHELKEVDRKYGNMHAILWDKSRGKVYAASDPRGEGLADLQK